MSEMDFSKLTSGYLKDARILVVKVGSVLLVDDRTGELRREWLNSLVDGISGLVGIGCRVVVVSSGSIALGRRDLMNASGRRKGRLKLEEKQAAAAMGQIKLAGAWQRSFARKGLNCAQILLSPDDTETRRRHLNARDTLLTLLDAGVVPVVNENDTVATTEIRYGDNDRLAARVAQMVSANALVLFSDIDGLYDSDPRRNSDSRHLAEVEKIDDGILAKAGPTRNDDASGGMITKLEAGRIANGAGCHMVICDGRKTRPLRRLIEGGRCTWFKASAKPPQARKKWIAAGLKPTGSIAVDAGAAQALNKGKSLLAIGITRIDGKFDRGDLVKVVDPKGIELGRGLSDYNSTEAAKIAGCKSSEIQGILGYRGRDSVIHADNLVRADSSKSTRKDK